MSDTIMSKKIGIMAFLSSIKIKGKQLNIREIFLTASGDDGIIVTF